MGDKAPLNDVDRWFERTARRRREPPSLYSALLTGKLFGYLSYRLRYPLLIATIRFAVHVAEFFILLSSLGGLAAFTVMMLRAGSLVVAGGWWGLLEIMRERIRTFADAGNRDASGSEIGRWLALAAVLAVTVTSVAAVVLLLWRPAESGPLARFYAFLIVVEFAIDIPVRVLHSGVFATRRVYKPAWSMLVPTLIQLAILATGFFFYPGWAIVVSIVVSNALSLWITVHFTIEVYRLMGLRPRFADPWWRDFPSIPARLGLATTLSGLSLRLDAVLVLALVGFYGTNTRTFDLTAALTSWENIDAFQFFYLILPLFRGTFESAGIFYFDLVRLRRTPLIRRLQLRFFRSLMWVAPAVGLFFWILAAGLGVLVLRNVPVSFLFALIPMFLLRSVIGVYQIRLFAEGRFAIQLSTLALLITLMWLVWLNPNPAGDLIQITAAMMVQLVVLINLQHLTDRSDPPLPTLLSPGDWNDALRRERRSVAAGTVTIPASITSRQKSAVVGAMRETFAGGGHFAFRSPTRVVYYDRRADAGSPADLILTKRTGGAAGRGTTLSVGDIVDSHCGTDTLVTEFRALFADGIVFDAETSEGSGSMRALDSAVLARILPASLGTLESGGDMVAVDGRWLTPVFQAGTLRLIFVLPADPDPARLRAWRETVRRYG